MEDRDDVNDRGRSQLRLRNGAVATVVLACGIGLFAPLVRAEGAEGRVAGDVWLERMNAALLPGHSMTAKGVLTTTDPSGHSDRTAFDFTRLTDDDGVARTLIEVTAPEEGKGIVYQIVSRPGEPLESWIWLPALGRLRRIEGIHRTDTFLDSEFTYEDLGLVAPGERGTGEVSEVGEAGGRRILLESGPYHYYGRVQTYIDPKTRIPSRVVFYDRHGRRFREQRFQEIQAFGDYLFPTVLEVKDQLTGTTSRLVFSDVKFDVPIPPTLYTESVVRQELRRGWEPHVPPG